MRYRVYLDYNVIEDLSKGRIDLPVGNYDIFCSVAHGEEYYIKIDVASQNCPKGWFWLVEILDCNEN